jgi:hypothetical protein
MDKTNKLNDLLDLFEIKELNDVSLRIAKKKVLMLHPDKNKVDTREYYLFFKSAYEKLTQIYGYIHHETNESNFKSHDIDTTFKDFIEKKGYTPKKNPEMYSKHFNQMFDNVHIKEDADGYQDWLKSDDDLYDKDDLEKSRKKLISATSLVKVSTIEAASSNNQYSDLKEAHINTIIGLDKEQVYKDMPKFKTEYELYRQKNMSEGLSERESLQYIADIEAAEKKQAVEMSYNLLRREEEMKQKQKEFNSRFLMLSN